MDRPRVELYRRIDTRCEEMLRDGMLRVRCSHESAWTARVYLREYFSLEAESEDAQAAELSLQKSSEGLPASTAPVPPNMHGTTHRLVDSMAAGVC